MTAMKIVQFSRIPSPLSIYVPNSSTISNEPPSPNDTCERMKSKETQSQVTSHLNWHTGIPGLWTQKLDAGPWTLHAGLWTLDVGLLTLNARMWTLKLSSLKLSEALETTF